MSASIHSLEASRERRRRQLRLPPEPQSDRESRLLRRAEELRLELERVRDKHLQITGLPPPDHLDGDEARWFLQLAQELAYEALYPGRTVKLENPIPSA